MRKGKNPYACPFDCCAEIPLVLTCVAPDLAQSFEVG